MISQSTDPNRAEQTVRNVLQYLEQTVERTPDAPAYLSEEEIWTWGLVHAVAARIGSGLVHLQNDKAANLV